MSFNYNPLKHIELVQTETNTIEVHCHGCGWDSTPVSNESPIRLAFALARTHIETSHGRTDSDFEGWSIY